MAVLLVLAAVVTLGVLARPAAAQDTWSSTTCGTCHNYSSGDAFHSKTTHASLGCAATCHSTGFSTPNPGACATAACHGTAAQVIAARPSHVSSGCGTTVGCHGYTAPPVQETTLLSAKVSPTTVKLGKKVKVSGTALPVPALANAKIAFKVERKVGTKWVKMKAPATATVLAAGNYTWTYKTVKKGSHRVTLSIKETPTYTGIAKLVKTFKVK
jgi:hypothetical protein